MAERTAEPTAGRKLNSRVVVAGRWYGPGDEIPDDVAARITNPKVWEGGVAPAGSDEVKWADGESTTTGPDFGTDPDAQAAHDLGVQETPDVKSPKKAAKKA